MFYKKIIGKTIVKILAVFIITMLLIITLAPSVQYAIGGQYHQKVTSGIESFPESYKAKLYELQSLHPNWKFEAYYTGMDWNMILEDQANRNTQYSRIYKNNDDTYYSYPISDANGFYLASKEIVGYYLDPRNFLNEKNIFEFEKLNFDSSTQTLEGVKKIVKGTFLDSSVYVASKGKNMTYSEIIYEAAKTSGMNPYAIKTKIIQEIGNDPNNICITGKYVGYEGFYNFFNYGGTDGGASKVKSLQFAKDKNWTDPFIAIVEGSCLITKSYTLKGQNTMYFTKFDLVGLKNLNAGESQTITRKGRIYSVYDKYPRSI